MQQVNRFATDYELQRWAFLDLSREVDCPEDQPEWYNPETELEDLTILEHPHISARGTICQLLD